MAPAMVSPKHHRPKIRTVFALVAALGRGDRTRALEILDTLAREGEYMPLALTFLGTQFRMALVAREAGQHHFISVNHALIHQIADLLPTGLGPAAVRQRKPSRSKATV